MGKQIRFDFDEIDEEILIAQLQQTEPWLAIPTPTPASATWNSPEKQGKRVGLLLCPARLAPEPTTLNDQSSAGRVLTWSRTTLPVNGETEIGRARIWIDTRGTDPTVLKAFRSVARAIATRSPMFADGGGAPVYIGPHLASRFESGALSARWPNGTLAKLQLNPRFKRTAPNVARRSRRRPAEAEDA